MNKIAILVFAAVLFLLQGGKVFPGVIALCDGMTYSNVMTFVSNLNMRELRAVVISCPLKNYDRNPSSIDGPVYDYNDAGSKFQRGSVATLLGDEAGLRALADFLNRRNIGLYARVDLFRQKKGYDRRTWNGADFTLDSQNSGGDLLVDIRNPDTRGKVIANIGAIRRLPVQKWVVDARYLPPDRRTEYVQFAAGNFGSSGIIFSDGEQNMPEVAHIRDYYGMRTNAFSTLQPNLKALEHFSSEGGFTHFIESDTPLVNNTGPLMFLLLQHYNVLVSSRILNRYHQALIDFIGEFGGYDKQIMADDRMILYNNDRMIAINYSDSFAVWKMRNPLGRRGFYKGTASGALLNLGDGQMTVFLFPKSIAFWDLRK